MEIPAFIPTTKQIMDFAAVILTDYGLIAVFAWKLLGKPIIMGLKWIASKTPWSSDDQVWNNIESAVDSALDKKFGTNG